MKCQPTLINAIGWSSMLRVMFNGDGSGKPNERHVIIWRNSCVASFPAWLPTHVPTTRNINYYLNKKLIEIGHTSHIMNKKNRAKIYLIELMLAKVVWLLHRYDGHPTYYFRVFHVQTLCCCCSCDCVCTLISLVTMSNASNHAHQCHHRCHA